ncbi:hypothetical protein LRS05_12810 [Flavobacterium sp. J372]|uniref:hypothetical protein n=1 Tax=Flavobacterium sp. J372 TaxID=2898436 RepID=UPI0021506D60|nr:hypothetical protein [Flavobacterium sp. J372]MCR5862960.1 hypothetical protein [Flavobacterium sp. J372]
MKNSFLKLYMLAFFLVSNIALYAQPGQDNPDGDLEGGDPPPAPINSKLIYLALVGIAFGFYYFMKKREEKLN